MSDGTIKISIEVDGKQVDIAAKQLDNLEDAGNRTGKGIKSAETSLDSLSDKSAKAGKDAKGAKDAIDGLGDSGATASKGLKGAGEGLDGITDKSAQASSSIKGASDSMENLSSSGDAASKGLNGVDGAIDEVADSSAQASDSVKNMSDTMADVDGKTSQASGSIDRFSALVGIGIGIVATKAFNSMRASLDQAIGRFDTMNAFPKVLEALGVSAEDSDRAINNLSDGIDGLPTRLNDIAASAQQMYNSFKDIDKTTDTAIALNNALLASGSAGEKAKRGTDQYIKSLQTGQLNMDTWNTLSETMGIGLTKIAEGLGFVGDSIENDLYKALQDGTVTFDEFNDKLVELGTGTGELVDLAKQNSLGLATSFGNLRNAIANGVTKIIESFNKLSEEVTGKEIAQHIDGLKSVVNTSFNAMKTAIESTTPVFKAFGLIISGTIAILRPFSPVIIGAATAFGAMLIVQKVSALMLNFSKATRESVIVTSAAELVTKAYATALKIYTGQLTLANAAEKVRGIITATNNKIIAASTLAFNVLTGRVNVARAAKIAFTAVTKALGTALKVASGPIGWVTIGIGALAGAVVAVVKWFKRSTEEGEKFKKETEELGQATESLTSKVEGSSKAYQDNVDGIELSAKKNSDLAKTVEELASKENKSAGEKALLQQHIEELNSSVEGLNLAYDEEAQSLNMSSKELQARLELMKETEAGIEAQERLTEITKEQEEIEALLTETIAKRKEIENDSNITKSEAKEATEALTEKEKELEVALYDLKVQQGETEQQIIESTENMTAAIEEGNLRKITSYEDLEGAHREVFDSMKSTYEDLESAATDAFDKIDTKTDHTMSSMIETMEHNQKQVEKWGENQAKLLEWAGDNSYENFIPYIENMGIDSAAELAVLAEAGDTELKKFADAVEKGADVASGGLKTSLGDGAEEAVENFLAIMGDGADDLRTQIKNSGFDEIGSMIPEGLKGGIDKEAPKVEKATEDMANKAIHATEDAFGIHSPSRVYKEMGGNLTEGLSLGVQQGTRIVLQAVQRMFQRIQSSSNTSFNRLNSSFQRHTNSIKSMIVSQFNSIGINAMSGLNNGLNAGKGKVMSTAHSIASSVASTMQRALKIHSPSRVMRDDVGVWIPEGITEGIEKNASSVYKALDNLSSNMVVSTPEAALGVNQMAYSSGANITSRSSHSPSNATSKATSANGQQVIKIEPADVIIDGRVAGKVLWKPIKKNIDLNHGVVTAFGGGGNTI